jgi:hypothetical protein
MICYTCTKCLTCLSEGNVVKYAILDMDKFQHIFLCIQCDKLYSEICDTMMLEFLREDYGNFPIGQVSKRMVEARKSRASGTSPWKMQYT